MQRDPRRYAHRDVGLVRQQNDRRVVGHFRKRCGKIIDADALDRPEPPRRKIGQLIAEPGKPERAAGLGQARCVVFVNRNPGGFERATRDGQPLSFALHRLVFPPVVIAEDRMHAERRLQPGEHGRPFARRNVARDMAMSGHVVAQHDDDVRIERVGAVDDRLDAFQRHPGVTGVNVGHDSYPEIEAGRPLRRRKLVSCDTQPQHGLAKSIGRGRDAKRAQPADEPKELSP